MSCNIQFLRGLSLLYISTAVCAGAAIVFVITIFISRIVKTRHVARFTKLRDDFQKTVNGLIVQDQSKVGRHNSSLVYYLRILRQKIRTPYRKQLLINILIANKQNLKGSSTAVLRKLYIRLHLKRFSRAKLNGTRLYAIVQGMQELAEMGCTDMLGAIQALFTHRKLMIRQESFIAMVRLASSSPFVLVDHYHDAITPSMQSTIHKHLATLSADRLPKFYRWFYSAHTEIRKFAVMMTNHFRQLDGIPHLARMLESRDLELAGMAAEVLGNMGAAEHAETIAALGRRFPMNEMLTRKIIAALKQIGNGSTHGPQLAWHMIHGSDSIRLEAMDAMRMLKLDCREYLVDFNARNDSSFGSIYTHINEPLLRK